MFMNNPAPGAIVLFLCCSCATQVANLPANAANNKKTIQSSAKGSVRLDDESWQIVDAVAMQEDNQFKIALTDRPYDLNEFSLDGKLDSFDILRHEGHTLTLNIDANGPAMCINFTNSHGGGSKCNSDFERAVLLKERTNSHISGSMHWGEKNAEHIRVTFDVPVQTNLQRTGESLPEDGGEPGKAVLAHFSAIAGGNFETIKAQTHPLRVASMTTTNVAEANEMIKMLQEMSPEKIKILGGVVNGENAIVDFTGENHGEKVKGVAKLSRYQERWYVDKTSESQQSNDSGK